MATAGWWLLNRGASKGWRRTTEGAPGKPWGRQLLYLDSCGGFLMGLWASGSDVSGSRSPWTSPPGPPFAEFPGQECWSRTRLGILKMPPTGWRLSPAVGTEAAVRPFRRADWECVIAGVRAAGLETESISASI